MAAFPQDTAFDSTLSLIRKGYRFISDKYRALDTDVFETRLLFRSVICMRGAEAARIFYDPDKFLRHGAMPTRAQKTLVGVDGVQSLDGAAHRHRKHLFISHLMNHERINALAELHRMHWHSTLALWPIHEEMVLFDHAQNTLCRSVCAWAGVPLPPSECSRRAKEFGLMIDSGARIGWHHWRGRMARSSSEKWLMAEIEKIRSSKQEAATSILQAFAWHRDEHGDLLPSHTAAVELINVLRPTVAIAQLVAFSALAIHQYPHVREKLLNPNSEYLDWFILEVRRFYPFFPFLAAYARQDFNWKGWRFKKGTLTLLDIYGTNHDGREWEQPDMFNPERFKNWPQDEYTFIASGGATYAQHHRCPGEWITNRLMKVALKLLVENLRYTVPKQDLSVSLARIPTLPKSGMIIAPLSYSAS